MTAESKVPSRTLIHIPIAHSREDMGSLGHRLPADEAYRQRVAAFWSEVTNRVQALALPWTEVLVYQDGLPNADEQIVHKILSEVNSPNYELLRWLVAQGATLIGTESPDLLKEEYGHVQAVLTATSAAARGRARRAYARRAAALLAERDGYIAGRIALTLPAGGIGLLFLGQAHMVAEHLPGDIDLRSPSRPGDSSAKPA